MPGIPLPSGWTRDPVTGEPIPPGGPTRAQKARWTRQRNEGIFRHWQMQEPLEAIAKEYGLAVDEVQEIIEKKRKAIDRKG